ncbi:DUF6988 family protein [Pseudomonas sp. RL_15y_Pfl2_60]|uniref:DUF6988 family protein n=1 Tax=Pseudomonas sp. RL_15y_Pfl2_60 TaxID=3088709 RepID=UPI0030D925B9
MTTKAIEQLFKRSTELFDYFGQTLASESFYDDDRCVACETLCTISMQHGFSLLMLSHVGNNISAASLLRLQFESLIRALWVLYVASDTALSKLTGELSVEALKVANKLPSVSEMIKALSRAEGFPPSANEMIKDLQVGLMSEMNSFVHAGIMPFKLQQIGTPEIVTIKNMKHSNAISTMTAMTLAIINTDKNAAVVIRKMQPKFADCLPPLIWPNNSPEPEVKT